MTPTTFAAARCSAWGTWPSSARYRPRRSRPPRRWCSTDSTTSMPASVHHTVDPALPEEINIVRVRSDHEDAFDRVVRQHRFELTARRRAPRRDPGSVHRRAHIERVVREDREATALAAQPRATTEGSGVSRSSGKASTTNQPPSLSSPSSCSGPTPSTPRRPAPPRDRRARRPGCGPGRRCRPTRSAAPRVGVLDPADPARPTTASRCCTARQERDRGWRGDVGPVGQRLLISASVGWFSTSPTAPWSLCSMTNTTERKNWGRRASAPTRAVGGRSSGIVRPSLRSRCAPARRRSARARRRADRSCGRTSRPCP